MITKIYVSGDTDGSGGRVLLTLAALKAIFYPEGTKDEYRQNLANLLEAEHNLIKSISQSGCNDKNREFSKYQSSDELQKNFKKIVDNCTIKFTQNDNQASPIFLGDVIFDRFSLDINSMLTLVKKINDAANNIVFLQGNHDVLNQLENIMNPYQFGGHASGIKEIKTNKAETNTKIAELTTPCIIKNNALFTHHGVYLEDLNKITYKISTAFGEIIVSKEIIAKMSDKEKHEWFEIQMKDLAKKYNETGNRITKNFVENLDEDNIILDDGLGMSNFNKNLNENLNKMSKFCDIFKINQFHGHTGINQNINETSKKQVCLKFIA